MIPIRDYWSLLHRYLRHQRARVALLAGLILTGIALQVANPQLVRIFIDRALDGDPVDRLIPLAAAFLVIAVAHQGTAVAATWAAEHVGWTATNELREDLADHLLHLDMSFHKRRSPGEMVERIDGDVTAISNFFGQFAVQIAGNLLLIAGVLAALTILSPPIGAASTALAVAAFAAMTATHQVSTRWWKDEREAAARYYGFVGEATAATEDLQGVGAQPFALRRAASLHRSWLPHAVRGWHGWSVLWSASISYYIVANVVVFALGGWLFARGTLTLGGVYLAFHYTEIIRQPLERVRSQMADMQKAGAAIARVRELLALQTTLPDTGTTPLPPGPLGVEIDGVDFAYDDDGGDTGRVLHGVTLELEPGRVLGVLGRTGSGKTTLARLLTRLHDPEQGEVRLGGVPLPAAPLRSVRARVGMVTQDVQLFRASIRDNLTFFDATIGDDRLWAALDELGVAAWARSQPAGLDTVLDAGGGGLSAGEAQLLAFTRIFLEDPGLIVLDEASSRVDPATERLIDTAMRRLLAGRTGVIIAHRLETVQRADDIVIVDDGRIVEHGRRADLAADPGSRFATLLRTGLEEVLA